MNKMTEDVINGRRQNPANPKIRKIMIQTKSAEILESIKALI
jgi:hypothetical protein